MKKIFYIYFFVSIGLLAQDRDELLEGLFDDEQIITETLLPEKMIFTQSLLWGKKGLFRKIGISKLSIVFSDSESKPITQKLFSFISLIHLTKFVT